jgi:uncharacterized protein YjbI with pentapeptide repeats
MLGGNVRQFLAELERTVTLEADRERCRQLLANVEFVQALIAPTGSPLYSWVWRWLVRLVIAIFPVSVLLLVQINALRYQSVRITVLQQSALLIDLLALSWFFYRNSLKKPRRQTNRRDAPIWRWTGLLWLPTIMGLNFYYLNVVPPDADPKLIRYQRQPPWVRGVAVPEKTQLYTVIALEYLHDLLKQPLDRVLCPWLRWGCRYLRVDHRLLVGHVWDDKAIVELQDGGTKREAEREKALASLEGLILRDRSLRFAALDESALFAADLRGADLTKASLGGAALLKITASGVELAGAVLVDADLEGAQLQGADLSSGQLEGANLGEAQLQGANLIAGNLKGVNLSGAQLQGANLNSAKLDGASLTRAELDGAQLVKARLLFADLRYAQLQGAIMARANLQAANLSSAQLNGADLSSAELQGADLRSAQLLAVDLRRALLHGTTFGQISEQNTTNLGLSDLRDADYLKPATPEERKRLNATLFSIIQTERKNEAIGRFDELSAAAASVPPLHFTASPKHQVLVDEPTNPIFKNIPKKWLVARPIPSYKNAFVTLLGDELASASVPTATGIALRVSTALEAGSPEDRVLYAAVACRLVANAAHNVVLEPPELHKLEFECERAQAVAR